MANDELSDTSSFLDALLEYSDDEEEEEGDPYYEIKPQTDTSGSIYLACRVGDLERVKYVLGSWRTGVPPAVGRQMAAHFPPAGCKHCMDSVLLTCQLQYSVLCLRLEAL